MAWKNIFSRGPCRVELRQAFTVMADEPLAPGGTVSVTDGGVIYEVSVSMAGEVSLSASADIPYDKKARARIYPVTPLAPGSNAGIRSVSTSALWRAMLAVDPGFSPTPASSLSPFAPDPFHLPDASFVEVTIEPDGAGVSPPTITFTPEVDESGAPVPDPDTRSYTAFVYTMNRAGAVGAWSIYDFPFPIDGFTHLDGGLYIRSGDDVLRVQPGELNDYAGDPRSLPFSATVEWPWLDFGQPGVMKRLAGFDIVGEGVATIEVGYNQATPAFTNPFDVGPDTVPGMIIPLPIMAPSMSVRVTYQGGQKWELYAMNLYLQDGRLTA